MLKAKEMSIRILFIAIAMTVSAVQADGHECYRVQSVSSIIRTPFEKPADGVLADKIDVIATPGEHEPASIVLFSKEDLSEVMLTSGDLVSESASIDASHVDVRIVKCWYQAGTAWRGLRIQPSIRILVPELLLKDDSLVKVDYEKRINYVRLDFEEGSRYVDMSRVNPQKQPGMLNSQFPVKDSATLKPFKLPAEHYKQIWFTFYVPRNTPAGLYKGLVKITSSEKLIGQLEVNLRVLPFRLADSGTYYDPDEPFVSSIYYKGILCTEKNLQKAGLRGWWKTEQQYRADLKNMLAHGVTNPHICQFEVDSSLETFAKILKMRQEIGMDNSTIYVHKQSNWGIGTNTDPKILQKAIDEIKQAKKVAENFGVKQLYIYAIDEAKGD
ncbi:MAG: hypothetical protein U9N87_05970, partial [Planctomycetota bacterium]|nr:hypothetical protein [Planctomycetota bacterium]